jgi:hypothetical protein
VARGGVMPSLGFSCNDPSIKSWLDRNRVTTWSKIKERVDMMRDE